MAEKVLILNGATRKNGNTDNIVARVMEGSKSTNVSIELITLREQKIGDCIGCDICQKEAKCSIRDDMQMVHDKIKSADLIIFASPVYWWGVTGIMKMLIDRLYFYYAPENKEIISWKKAIVVSPMNMNRDIYKTKIFVDFFDIVFENLEIEKVGIFLFDHTSQKGDFLQNPDDIERALTIGKQLDNL